MLSYATLVLAAAAAVSVDAHSVHRRDHRLLAREVKKPATYFEPYLEPYKVYHTRYLALNCQDKHNTTFFDDCCHPMLSTETLEKNRKPFCTPDPDASASASAAEPTSTVIPDDDEEDCEDEDEEEAKPSQAVKHATTAPPKAAAPAPSKFTTVRVQSADKPQKTDKPEKEDKPEKNDDNGNDDKDDDKPVPSSGKGLLAIGTVHTGGIATFFTQNGVAGACGKVHKDTDLVAAMTPKFYGSFSQKSSVCGRKIEITRVSDGRKVTVSAEDGCPTCETDTSIDLSVAAFEKIATKNEGIAKITWKFVS